MTSTKIRAQVVIYGRVTMVGLRAAATAQATKLGLTGWVRNVKDSVPFFGGSGCVEAVFEGPKNQVEKMIEWCQRGPILAKIEKCEVSWENPTGEFETFEIKY